MGDMKTQRQWASITAIPYSTIRQAVREGQLPAMRFTPKGQIYISSKDMEKFIEDAKTRALKDDD
jgi:predicted site-specific integrase-resolvase